MSKKCAGDRMIALWQPWREQAAARLCADVHP